jgi:SNF2 family DNA or RNA helicase
MAGLTIKELKFRGLVLRVLIITPANLTDQWRRELHDKFGETFTVVNRGAVSAS